MLNYIYKNKIKGDLINSFKVCQQRRQKTKLQGLVPLALMIYIQYNFTTYPVHNFLFL